VKLSNSSILTFGIPLIALILTIIFSLPISGANPNLIANSDEDIEAGEFCVDCHDEQESSLHGTLHEPAMIAHGQEISCINCHSDAAVHVEDPNIDNIGSPGNMDEAGVLAVCTQCHQPHMALDNTGFDPHISEGLACTSCHNIHQGQDKLLIDDKLAFCGECHQAVINQFVKTSNHPLTDGAVSCLSCHDFTGKLQPAFAHGSSANCYSCHPMEGGPYLYEHQAASSFATEGSSGCVDCHSPHGSSNDKLLNRPNNVLCQQCHGTPARHYVAHGGIGKMFNCTECHTEMHGSNDNRGLLDPNLGLKLASTVGDCMDCHRTRFLTR